MSELEQIAQLLDSGDADGLTELLSAGERDTRAAAAQALGQLQKKATIPTLIAAMGDKEVQVRQAAAEALVEFGEAAVPSLVDSLEGRGGRVAPYALWALGEIGSRNAVGALIDTASEARSWRIRWSAVEALGDIGGQRAIQTLIDALDDRDERVRNAACLALVTVGAPAVGPLAAALRGRNGRVRREGLRSALRRIGTPAALAALRNEQLARWIPVLMAGIGLVLILLWVISVILM